MAGFFSIGAEERVGNKLIKLNQLLNWKKLKAHLKGIHKNAINSLGGSLPYDVMKMVKAILLWQWHNLSDPKLEESLRVRLDFILFTGFELSDALPDEMTLCRFRNKLVELGLDKILFLEINRQLEKLGLQIESAQGAVIDATVIASAARPKTSDYTHERSWRAFIGKRRAIRRKGLYGGRIRGRGCEVAKKGKRCYFAYKGFISTARPQDTSYGRKI